MSEESLPQSTKAPVPVQTHILRLKSALRKAKHYEMSRLAMPKRNGKHPPTADPVNLLVESSKGRGAELLPIRYGRMMAAPFAFYRGRHDHGIRPGSHPCDRPYGAGGWRVT